MALNENYVMDLWSRLWGGNFTYNPIFEYTFITFELQLRKLTKTEKQKPIRKKIPL